MKNKLRKKKKRNNTEKRIIRPLRLRVTPTMSPENRVRIVLLPKQRKRKRNREKAKPNKSLQNNLYTAHDIMVI